MNGGVPPTEPKARTGEFTPPGIRARARWKSSSEEVTEDPFREKPGGKLTGRAPRGAASGLDPLGDLGRPVGEDQVRPGPADAEDRFQHRGLAVDPAVRGGGLDHRVLAGNLVGG